MAVTVAVVLPPAYIWFFANDKEMDERVTFFLVEMFCDAVICVVAAFADNETVNSVIQ